MKLMTEFLSERTEGYNVGVYEMDNLIMFVGDIHCGLAIYGRAGKSFHFYVAKNIDAILESDDAEVYDEVDIEPFIKRLCEQDDDI